MFKAINNMVHAEMLVSDNLEMVAKYVRNVPKGHFPVASRITDHGIVDKASEISVRAKEMM